MTLVPGRPAARTTSATLSCARKGAKRKTPPPCGFEALVRHPFERNHFGAVRDGRALDGESEFQARATGQLRITLFAQHPLNGAHRKLNTLFAQQFGDLARRQVILAPVAELAPNLGADAPARDTSLGDGLGEVDFAVAELVAKQAHVSFGVTETFGDDTGREALDERGAQGLVASLPVGYGASEEGGVSHEVVILSDG